jgi:hypothetical protein
VVEAWARRLLPLCRILIVRSLGIASRIVQIMFGKTARKKGYGQVTSGLDSALRAFEWTKDGFDFKCSYKRFRGELRRQNSP